MNKNFKLLNQELSRNGFDINVPHENFIVVSSPIKSLEPLLKEFFIRCAGSKVLVFTMIQIDDLFRKGVTKENLAFVLSDKRLYNPDEYNIQISFKEGCMILSSMIYSPHIFPFRKRIYSKVYDKIIQSSVQLQTILDALE